MFNGAPVKSFYADDENQRKQIKICYYNDR